MDEFLLEAMREVDALTPACPPIAPMDLDRIVTANEDAWEALRAKVAADEARRVRLLALDNRAWSEMVQAKRRARIRG